MTAPYMHHRRKWKSRKQKRQTKRLRYERALRAYVKHLEEIYTQPSLLEASINKALLKQGVIHNA